jgi:hypothetical protein
MRIRIFLPLFPDEHELFAKLIGASAKQAAQAEQEEIKLLLVTFVTFLF